LEDSYQESSLEQLLERELAGAAVTQLPRNSAGLIFGPVGAFVGVEQFEQSEGPGAYAPGPSLLVVLQAACDRGGRAEPCALRGGAQRGDVQPAVNHLGVVGDGGDLACEAPEPVCDGLDVGRGGSGIGL
jgi:hypothetical protein